MICVSIGRSRHKQVMAEHRHLVEQGAKLVELRLDYISTRLNLSRLLKDRPCPVIVTCRREEDGGKWTGSEEDRQRMLREAIVLKADYVDIEEDIAGEIRRFGPTKRIISLHNFRNTPTDLEEIHARLAALDADIVKIATMAQNTSDNLRVLQLIKNSDVPTVAMCMGDIGTPSRILCGKFGSPFTYATFHHERALAPGQLSYQQMNEVYRYESIKPDTQVFGVIADPVGHSLSPHIHNVSFAAADINAVYVPFRVPADNLADFIKEAPQLDIKGLSVTIPHKESIARCLTKVSPEVKGIKAVNTVVMEGDEIFGINYDYLAAMQSLEHAMGGIPNKEKGEESPLKDQKVLVLGAGGVARAIMYGLKARGAKSMITNRSRNRADKLAEEFGGRAVDWNSRHNGEPNVIINCTPIGMHPNVDESPYNKSYLKPSMVVFDTVYNPESTLLIKEARSHGCKVVTGVEMFVGQAGLQFLKFTGKKPPLDLMRETLKRVIGPVKY